MSSKWRRFEVLLPLQFNDGREVPAEWLAEAVLEVVRAMKGPSGPWPCFPKLSWSPCLSG